MTDLIDRPRLVADILSRRTPIIVLDAPAGMGKTALLRLLAEKFGIGIIASSEAPAPAGGERPVLWDIPPYGTPEAIPDGFLNGGGRLIVAKRPNTSLPGLSRALVYRQASQFAGEDLIVSPEELEQMEDAADGGAALEHGGWPLLAFNRHRLSLADGTLAPFLRSELLDQMADTDLVDLRILLDGGTPLPQEARSLLPFARRDADGRAVLTLPALAGLIGPALDDTMDARITQTANTRAGSARAGSAGAIAEAYRANGRIVAAIETLQKAGFFDLALRLFQEAGGYYVLYYAGPKAFERVLAGFPLTFAVQSEAITLSKALQALKQGDVAHARRLLIDRFGETAHDLDLVFSARSIFSRPFRAFRLVMLIYEDYFFSEDVLERAYAMIADFPLDDHLARGSFYNSVLEFYIRNRRFAAAEEVAQRAMFHYQAARAPHLCFYISLHQALIRLMMGDALAARKHALQSAAHLAEMGFESPNDMRLQALLDACIEYEGGKAEPLARFLSLEIDDFAHGEIWPSVLEFALHYGSQALGEHFSPLAARSFLDRWRVYQTSNGQFQAMIALRDATVLQNANRWQEAAAQLGAIRGRIDRNFVLCGSEEVTRVQERDELALALAWLRQITYEMPQRENLEQLITTMTRNLNLTDRQRISAEIWLAYVAKRQRNPTRARAVLQKTFDDCARLGAIAPLAEERIFLQELIDNQRIGGFLATVPAHRQIIRKLRDAGRLSGDGTARSILSRRESKILMMICEGAANKFVANTLGLSEATVKFHLGNVYRKLGCRTRQEAISAARALDLVQ